MAVLGSLSVKLGLVTVDWDKATDQAKLKAKELDTAFKNVEKSLGGLSTMFQAVGGIAGITTVGLTALTASTMSYANEVKDLSDGYDISIAKTLQFRNAIEVSGGSAESANRILTKLFSQISSAKEGNSAAIKTFEDLGISWKELNSLTPEKSINRVFDALANGSADTFKRIAEIKELTGKQGVGLDVKQIAQLLSETTAEYEKHADAIKRVGDANDAMKTSMDNLKIAFADIISPLTNKDNVIAIETFKAAILVIGGGVVINGIRSLAVAYTALAVAMDTVAASGGVVGGTFSFIAVSAAAATVKIKGLAGSLAAWATTAAGAATLLGIGTMLYSSNLNEGEDEWLAQEKKKQQEAAKEKAAKEQGAKDTPAVAALKSKVEMTQKLMELESKSADLKARAFTLDEYSVKNAEIGLEMEKEKAKAKDELVQYLGTEKRTQEEIAGANAVYSAQTAAAERKAADARKVLAKQEERELQVLGMKSKLQKDIAKLDMQSLDLGHQKQFISDYDFNVANEQLNSQKKILAIREQIKELNQGNDAAGRKHYQAVKQSLEDEITAEQEASQKRQDIMKQDETRRLDILQSQANMKQELAKLDLDSLDLQHKKVWMSDYEYNVANERLESEKKLVALREQLAELPKGTDAQSIAHYQELSKVIEDEIAIEQAASQKRLDLFAEDAVNRESFMYGWEQAWFQYQKNASDASAKGAQAFTTLMGDMNSALDKFVETGKISFSDLISSMIKDLLKLAMQAQMNSIIGSIFGMGGGGGSFLTSSSTNFANGGGVLGFLGGLFSPHANGGGYGANEPILVGERGPELMIPNKAGAIVPNSSLATTMGNQGQTVYNGPVIQNMQAIDTQSGIQFLAKNKNTIWAVNQSANRSIPMSRG
ncbi:Bacteriophage lambda, GpH, tail tape measure, C-terminal [uncultured Caudovirales phage]|uniref:Bacteriophage lambda, GpH, tail tape measure, C-terminal n=1 Tax=uncultured Caudovirales phage TaxID=2100421 RepID=A0A6J5LI89_9CAUD|nr:Bacteriophage lambda, GpH, tail tape measure, C-terminal [uncultured Caudovirales phage]CAB4242011.1 Bacteriophage lambda, GpH, tail tape measure, C-terminal [uncultured Caudovirales phage]